jgi:DNA-binding winged helix-turn-helix (wHTH) protein/tetratricopeptide (TPR) repeat protein
MEATPSRSKIVRFGLFEADLEKRQLWKSGVRLKLHDQPFQILILLLERRGEIVSRDELRQRLWPGNTFVEFDNGLNVAVTKLRTALSDDAENPRFVETVPRRGYRFVAPIAVASSHAATTSSGENPEPTSVAPASLPVPSPAMVVAAREKPNKRHQLAIGVMTVVLVMAGIAAYHWRALLAGRASAKSKTTRAIMPRRSVAVLGFRNLPGRPEEDWLTTAFSEMLSTELAAGGGLRLVSEEDVSRAKHDLRITGADTLAKSTLAGLRINSGADIVVVGSCTPIAENGHKRLRVDLRLQDTASGETIAEEAFTGDQENLFDVASQAGARLRSRLGAAPASTEAMNAARAALPSNEQAARLYAEGRAKLLEFDFLAARDLLVKAVAADPENPVAHSALAEAWSALGYDTTAQEQAKQAFDLSTGLSREEQLLIEGRYRALTWDWPKAVEIYRALTQFFPDNLEYGLRLATVLSMAGRSEESMLEVAALRQLPRPISDDPRIDLREANTFDHAGQYQRLQVAAANAAAKAQGQGSRILLAEARLQQSLAASRLNDPKGALALVEEAQEVYKEIGDQYGVARAQYRIADLLFQRGEFAESNAMLEHCLQVFRALGSERYAAETLNDIAGGLFEMGDLSKAREMYEAALASQRQVRSKRGIAETLSNLGELLEQQGDLTIARKYDEEALAIYNELGEKGAIASMQNNEGIVLMDQGDLAGGKSLWEQSLALRRELDNESDVAESLHNLAEALGEQGDVAGAQKLFDEALAIQASRGEQGNAAGTRLGKAELLLESGSPGDSEPLLRAALEQFKKERQVQQEGSAHATLAEAYLALGRLNEAKAEVGQATALANKNEGYGVRLKIEIVTAEVLAAEGKPDDAARNLRRTIKDAQSSGFFLRRLEATLALAEAEAKSGKKRDARSLLESVEENARGKGFLLIAHRAAVARHAGRSSDQEQVLD